MASFYLYHSLIYSQFSSVLFSHSVLPDSLQPHGLQHIRLPCPSAALGAYSNSCPLSGWHHPIISSSVIPFSSRLQSFQASGSFQMSQLFTSGGQSIRVSASTSVFPMNIQDWFPLGWTGTLCALGPRDPTETETELCMSISCGDTGQQWTATGTGALGAADLGMAYALFEGFTINPTIELSELTQHWQ